MNLSNTDQDKLSRRDAIKTLGLSGAVLGLGALTNLGRAAEPSAAAPALLALPKLPYAYAALEPHIDAQTMEIHHSKHHQAYITNANKALEPYAALLALGAEGILKKLGDVPESIRTVVRNNVGGHVNHSFFWKIIGPNAGGQPEGQLAEAITSAFGNFEGLKIQFSDTAMKRFGSGWAWLVRANDKLAIRSTANQDSPLADGETPVLGLDVWEHAYYLKHQNRRADYVTAFWNVINWEQADANYRGTA
jgi:Fe-Mn family superoxide dismutase